MTVQSIRRVFAVAVCQLVLFSCAALAHEPWLLTPTEVEALGSAPIPPLFLDHSFLGLAAFITTVLVIPLLFLERYLLPIEAQIFARARALVPVYGPLLIRLSLGLMLVLGATGGLPRHGFSLWEEPVLLVPDLTLSQHGAWTWLLLLEGMIGIQLILGWHTRLAAFLLGFLCLATLYLFGDMAVGYVPHFVAPALFLLLVGGGKYALDSQMEPKVCAFNKLPAEALWWSILILTGGCFLYLGVVYKLSQPTLLIAILDAGEVPLLGLPLSWAAFGMMMVEIVLGLLLAQGRLVRPIAVALMCAFVFFAVTLGETLLYHANLIGLMIILFICGRDGPKFSPDRFERLRYEAQA